MDRISESGSQWKKQLTLEQFKVTRKKGTERPRQIALRYCINSASLKLDKAGKGRAQAA